MNYIYDVVLNFFDYFEAYDFYEWDKNDCITIVQRIPIIRISSEQMEEISYHQIHLSSDFLERIENHTITDCNIYRYSFLITDLKRVIALFCSDEGISIKRSFLLLDEEDFVMDEAEDYPLEELSYELLGYCSNSFMTRKEKSIQKELLKELDYLYHNKKFDEINYLYQELYSDSCSISKKYSILFQEIKNNFQETHYALYDIVQLTQKQQ